MTWIGVSKTFIMCESDVVGLQVLSAITMVMMEDLRCFGFFSEPVNAGRLRLPDYTSVIRTPMDLGTVRRCGRGGQSQVEIKYGVLQKNVVEYGAFQGGGGGGRNKNTMKYAVFQGGPGGPGTRNRFD